MGSRDRSRGMALVFMAVLTALLLGFAGLAIDAGRLQWTQQRAQTAADSAAVAAMLEMNKSSSDNTVTAAARNDAGLNGFTNGQSGTTVTVNNPPLSGNFAGDDGAVEVIVRRSLTNFFMGAVGQPSTTVSARAVAKVGTSGGCMYALNPTAYRSFQLAGSNSTLINCGVLVASNHSTEAFSMEGSGVLRMGNGSSVGVVGGWRLHGQTSVVESPSGVRKDPVHVDSVSDPLARVAAPTMSSLVVRSMSTADYDMNRWPSGGRINPGIYCGGLRVGNTGSQTLYMNPGVYVMAGGGFTFNSQARISGTGVTIYSTSGAASGVSGCNAGFNSFTISGQVNLTLSAPTSGQFEGIAIFQDRAITSSNDNQINGGSTTVINGAIYLRNSPIRFSGNHSSGGYLIIVADKIVINGNSTVNSDYAALDHGSPVKSGRSVLAE